MAPLNDDEALQEKIESLRNTGEIVVQALKNDQTSHAELNCNRELKNQNGEWQIVPLTE